MKIVILDGYTENPGDLSWEGFEALGDVVVYDRTPVELIQERIGDADAVIVNKVPITEETLDKCTGIVVFRFVIYRPMVQMQLVNLQLPCY
ncbi:MAG: glycerate dehydrogenase [Anaerocolumna sp.]|nr:glycerate dehydrogenase [Anaerocolumna sp.]